MYTDVNKNIFVDCKYTVTLASLYNCSIQMHPAWLRYFWSSFTTWFPRNVTITRTATVETHGIFHWYSCSIEFCVIKHNKYIRSLYISFVCYFHLDFMRHNCLVWNSPCFRKKKNPMKCTCKNVLIKSYTHRYVHCVGLRLWYQRERWYLITQ